MDWDAIALSVRLAGCTTLILAALGLPLAYWLAVSQWRWKFLVEAVVTVPLVLPPTVLGFYLLFALGPNAPLGRAYQWLTGESFAFTFTGLLIGSVLYNLPFAVRPFVAAFAGVDRRLVEASWCLGVSRMRTFFRVVVPLAWAGIVGGLMLSFAHTMGEFGVVMMIGGNLQGLTRTASTAIYDKIQGGPDYYADAGQMALFLLCFSFLALVVTYVLQRKVRM
jgi:molybdate transport system permease protein